MVAKPTVRSALLMATISSILAGCAAPPVETAPAPRPPSPTATPEPRPSVPAPAPAPAPAAPVVPAAPPAPVVPATPAQQQQAQRQALAAVELLENGNEDQARTEIAAALATDSNNRLALNLLKQLDADPVALLGRESFAYTVRPADTLSRIAGRFLGDIFSFYALARYNDIKVPKQVSAGQVLRIPGRAQAEREAPPPPAPVRTPPPAPAQAAVPRPEPVIAAPVQPAAPAEPSAGLRALRSAEAAERAGEFERALGEYNRAASLDQPEAAAKAGNVRRRLVSNHTQAARAAMANQDLDATIRNWDRVLEIDASNETARLERQRALTLRDKLRSLPR